MEAAPGQHRDGPTPDVVVVGSLCRDLVTLVDTLPPAGKAATVRRRVEAMGGKGANQAVALSQLGCSVSLVASVGDDSVGRWLRARAVADGIDTRGVAVRPNLPSGLVVSVVDARGSWRYLEDLALGSLVTVRDIRSCEEQIRSARILSLQLQQPFPALLEAASIAAGARVMIAADGAPTGTGEPRDLLRMAQLVRADQHEAELLAGQAISDGRAALDAARRLLEWGPEMVVLAAGAEGNAVAWQDPQTGAGGAVLVPHLDVPVIDTTGGGDAFVAGFISSLLDGADPCHAACRATAAAGHAVRRLGGRPMLCRSDVAADAARLEGLVAA